MSEINNKDVVEKIDILLSDILGVWIRHGKFKIEYDFLKNFEIKRRNPTAEPLKKSTASEYTIIIKLDHYNINLRKVDNIPPNISLDLIIELLNNTLELFKKYVIYEKIRNDKQLQTIISNIKKEEINIKNELNSIYRKGEDNANSN